MLDISPGFILASNHSSYLDWLVLYSIFKRKYGREIVFLAKEKLFSDFVWGKLVKAAKCIKVTDSGIGPSSMKRIAKLIKNRGIVGVFPEGTRSDDGELLQAKEGIIQIAMKTKAPIVPVGLLGFYEIWPKGRWIPRFNPCKIIVGDPIFVESYLNKGHEEGAKDALRVVMSSIGRLINKQYKF